MTFTELTSPEELTDFLNQHATDGCIVAFSGTYVSYSHLSPFRHDGGCGLMCLLSSADVRVDYNPAAYSTGTETQKIRFKIFHHFRSWFRSSSYVFPFSYNLFCLFSIFNVCNKNEIMINIDAQASWCDPCKASKPRLKELSENSGGKDTIVVPVGYVLEDDLEDFLEIFVAIKSFPTYIFFREGKEIARTEGVNFDALTKMVKENK